MTHPAHVAEIPLALITERMLFSALREHDLAARAELARERAQFLADASLRFGASLDEEQTYEAIAGMSLPGLAGWAIVDIVEPGGRLRRLAVVHSDPAKQAAAEALVGRWTPAQDDPIGVPAMIRERRPIVILDRAAAAAAAAARDPETLRVLRWLGAGSLLIVPILLHDAIVGAITFVNRVGAAPLNADDIAFGEAVAAHCAQAIESARLYAAARAARAAADAARDAAEKANEAKASFLSMISHELRTPLNAIGGYAQLIELGVRGPVTASQLSDLSSIQRNKAHLLGLVGAVLNYAQIKAGSIVYEATRISLREALKGFEEFVAPQMLAKSIAYTFAVCDESLMVRAEAAKLRQIILNLLSNATKFTPAGGKISMYCEPSVLPHDALASAGAVEDRAAMHAVHVTDSGIGISAASLDSIFDPFVQVNRQLASADVGIGLGLAISRDLARGMGGDLRVRSEEGVGTTFTLTLPAA